MTLEQAIEFCLHMSKEQYKSAHNIIRGDYPEYEATPHFRLASEYKQLAEWLMEVKDLKEENKFLISEFDRLIKERVKERAELLKKSEQIAEYKRLLKAAVEDMTGMQFGKECKVCSKKLLPNECPIHNNISCIFEKDFKWRYADEAEKLLKED